MIKYVATLGFWAAVVINLFLWRNSRDHSTFWAVLMLALGLTVQVQQIYFQLDPYLGGRNWLAVISDLLVLAGVTIVINGITQKLTGQRSHSWSLIIAATIVAVALVVTFSTLTPEPTAASVTLAYHTQFATHLYNLILFLAFAVAFVYTAIVCISNFFSLPSNGSRVGVSFIILGCVAGLAMCLASYSMTFGYLWDQAVLAQVGRNAYSISRTLTVVLVTVGMALPPAAAWLSNRSADLAIQRSIETLQHIHQRLEAAPIPDDADLRQRLTRMIVDINDSMLRHGEEAVMQGDSTELLERAEAALLSQNRRTAYPHETSR